LKEDLENPDFEEDYQNEPITVPEPIYGEDPIRHQTELDAKIISTGYNDLVLHLKKPIYKKIQVAVLHTNHKGELRLLNGKPVFKKMKTVNVFDHYEEKDVDFPIKNFYSDSLTSSIIDKDEANAIRGLDDLIWVLAMKTVVDPDSDFTKFMWRLFGVKASLVDTAKAIGGGALEYSKTTITKGEQRSYDFRADKGFEDYQNRLKKKGGGLLGLGFLGL